MARFLCKLVFAISWPESCLSFRNSSFYISNCDFSIISFSSMSSFCSLRFSICDFESGILKLIVRVVVALPPLSMLLKSGPSFDYEFMFKFWSAFKGAVNSFTMSLFSCGTSKRAKSDIIYYELDLLKFLLATFTFGMLHKGLRIFRSAWLLKFCNILSSRANFETDCRPKTRFWKKRDFEG